MKTSTVVAATLLSFLSFTCKEGPPSGVRIPTLALVAEDASCTEAWLRATTTETPATARLLRDGQRVSDLRLVTSDTLLLDEGLLPRRTYTYQLQKLAADSSVVDTSARVQVTTMDTTSHNFTWQIDTLGVTSSVLYDVAIISPDNIWAVGELYLNDSSGQLDPILYNAAHWDGQRWEIKRITVMFRGNPVTVPLEGVLAHSATDIWVAGSIPIQ